jgi:hypothetical protein
VEKKKRDVPPTPAKTWRMKIEIDELEDEMTQHGEDQMQRLAIEVDIKAP